MMSESISSLYKVNKTIWTKKSEAAKGVYCSMVGHKDSHFTYWSTKQKTEMWVTDY